MVLATGPHLGTMNNAKVAIVGCALSSCHQAPAGNNGVDLWATSRCAMLVDRPWNAIFEPHFPEEWKEINGFEDWLKAYEGPGIIYAQKAFPDIPGAVPLPLDSLVAKFGPYFTSTVAYMAGLAILKGYKWIGVFGVDMGNRPDLGRTAAPDRYAEQRACIEGLLRYAQGMGVEVYVPESSALFWAPALYGFETLRGKPING